MRTRNREINIFNMSLLDILTGMLGAFLFLMIGLVPYYAKVLSSQLITPEERQKFEELKKLLDKGLKGPLSPEEVEQLKNEMARLTSENDRLTAQNKQLQGDLDETKKNLATSAEQNNFWSSNRAVISLVAFWDSKDADIDVLLLTPDGKIFGPKKEKLFGKDVLPYGTDSHGPTYASQDEGVVAFLDGPGDYLVFYRVPKNAAPASYTNLRGFVIFHDDVYSGNSKGNTANSESGLGDAKSSVAKPGGLYAWAIVNYDTEKRTITVKPAAGKLPPGIVFPQ